MASQDHFEQRKASNAEGSKRMKSLSVKNQGPVAQIAELCFPNVFLDLEPSIFEETRGVRTRIWSLLWCVEHLGNRPQRCDTNSYTIDAERLRREIVPQNSPRPSDGRAWHEVRGEGRRRPDKGRGAGRNGPRVHRARKRTLRKGVNPTVRSQPPLPQNVVARETLRASRKNL
jgi:hypothetical protein